MAVLPLIATDQPKLWPAVLSVGSSLAIYGPVVGSRRDRPTRSHHHCRRPFGPSRLRRFRRLRPNGHLSPAAPSFGRSLAICWPDVVSKRYAEPESMPLSASCQAPTIAVVPLIDTSMPNSSPAAPSIGRSLAICWPVVTLKRYAEPELSPLSSSRGAPTIAMFPLIAT